MMYKESYNGKTRLTYFLGIILMFASYLIRDKIEFTY